MSTWQVQQAKARLSEVLDAARDGEPQTITRHGVDQAVVLSSASYRELTHRQPDLRQYLLGGPRLATFRVRRRRDVGTEPAA